MKKMQDDLEKNGHWSDVRGSWRKEGVRMIPSFGVENPMHSDIEDIYVDGPSRGVGRI